MINTVCHTIESTTFLRKTSIEARNFDLNTIFINEYIFHNILLTTKFSRFCFFQQNLSKP